MKFDLVVESRGQLCLMNNKLNFFRAVLCFGVLAVFSACTVTRTVTPSLDGTVQILKHYDLSDEFASGEAEPTDDKEVICGKVQPEPNMELVSCEMFEGGKYVEVLSEGEFLEGELKEENGYFYLEKFIRAETNSDGAEITVDAMKAMEMTLIEEIVMPGKVIKSNFGEINGNKVVLDLMKMNEEGFKDELLKIEAVSGEQGKKLKRIEKAPSNDVVSAGARTVSLPATGGTTLLSVLWNWLKNIL